MVPLFLAETLHSSRSVEFTGALFMIGGGIALGMAGVWGTLADRYGFRKSLVAGLVGACLGELIMSASPDVAVFAVGYILTIAFSCEFGSMIIVWLTRTPTGSAARGLVLGTNNSLTLLGVGLGLLLAGSLTQLVGIRFMLAISALLLAACLVSALVAWRKEARRAGDQHRSDRSTPPGNCHEVDTK
jgi:MFS family permease